jgi:hypothetical protein
VKPRGQNHAPPRSTRKPRSAPRLRRGRLGKVAGGAEEKELEKAARKARQEGELGLDPSPEGD